MWKRLFAPDDEDITSQGKDLEGFLAVMPEDVRLALTAVDQLPGAYGPFGYTQSNPIPVNGPIGEAVYIFRLRGKSDRPFLYQRLGSMDSQEFSRKLDVYELFCSHGGEWIVLFFSMYHLRRSVQCPDGLKFVSWKKHRTPFGIAAKLGAFGSSTRNEDFPFSLPRIIRSSQNLLQIGPRIPEIQAETIQKILRGASVPPRPYDLAKLSEQLHLVNWA
jgi:hypothetical protein